MKALIVDDEKPARLRLRSLLNEVPTVEVVGEAQNGDEAVRLIDELRPDVVFLDVQMPVMNGFQVLERAKYMPDVVFVTAWDEYAIRAFEVNAIDYLLKPYSSERLIRAVERAAAGLRATPTDRSKLLDVLKYYRETDSRLLRITVHDGQEYRVIPLDSVDFFRAEEGLVFVYVGKERHVVDRSLQSIEDNVSPVQFVRIHRNALLNLSRVGTVAPGKNGKYLVEAGNGELLIVSRDRVKQFKSLTGFAKSHRIRPKKS
ncbi:MAG TPA: LytTR family DNA-binding domain-containing protein [Spirochaetia bacterium]|nr:LytTR family DNA-binding domain-containing protein [Spirochaetia bacterium]